MALTFGEISRFVRENGNVTAWATKGTQVTLLRNGEIDSVAYFENDADQFIYEGKPYTRAEFEKLVRRKSQ